ncbi:MAG: TetR/AcrR family transcriptional regulator [Pseudoxanthomonas sp.]
MKVRTESRREAIIETAAQLFQEAGYERASMNELAKRVGGSKTTLYGYFPSKESLFEAVVRTYATSHLSDATAGLKAEGEKGVALEPALMHFGERMLAVLTNDTRALAVYRMVIAESGRSDLGQLFHRSGPTESIAALSAFLKAAMENGTLRRSDPELRAQQFLALVTAEIEGRMYERYSTPLAPPQIRRMVKRAVEMFLSGAA